MVVEGVLLSTLKGGAFSLEKPIFLELVQRDKIIEYLLVFGIISFGAFNSALVFFPKG